MVLHHCQTTELSLMGLPFHLNGLHFGLEDHLPTRIYEELATIGKSRSEVMTSLTLPQIPPMFVPLVLANHGTIRGKKIRDLPRNGLHFLHFRIGSFTLYKSNDLPRLQKFDPFAKIEFCWG